MRALLTHAWLFLGKWLGRLLLLLLAVGLGGWAIGSLYYAWKFSGPVSAEEQIAPDEARITQAIIQDAIRVVEQHRDNTRVLRDAHAKAHGCVKAEFKVRADLDPTLRRGVFAEAGKSWNAWVRFSNGNAYPQFDSKNDARGMAIKLLDVPGEKLLPGRGHDGEQDFVMFNQPVFFIRDIAEYRQNFAAQADGKKALAFFPNWNPTSWELRHLLIALRTLAPPRTARCTPATTASRRTSWANTTSSSASSPPRRSARPTSYRSRTRTCPTSSAPPCTSNCPSTAPRLLRLPGAAPGPGQVHAHRRHQRRMEGVGRALRYHSRHHCASSGFR